MSGQQMSLPDVMWMVDRCEQIVTDTPKLLSYILDVDYISNSMKKVKSVFQEKNPPLGMVLRQLHIILTADKSLRKIIRSECEQNFESKPMFPFFMFWCTVIMYTEYLGYIRIQQKQETEGEE